MMREDYFQTGRNKKECGGEKIKMDVDDDDEA
jgi:hypothetical protein